MKASILFTLIVSGVIVAGGAVQFGHAFSASEVQAQEQVQEQAPAPEQGTGQSSEDGHELERELKLQRVNGISLYDDRQAVATELGEPEAVKEDELFGEVTYQYPSNKVQVVFYGEYIQAVNFQSDVGELMIDDMRVEASVEGLKSALGEPDYIAEDGIVFQRDEALLKAFIDPATGELLSISYYHLATV